ncbi:hypothetical protein [Streptomyces sp. NPDC008141]|uniref:hypothetical protein n=1 Tax=Streptomyces sp. NPDC008141 TaxID=3364815 RepID=UPI0036F01CCC
MSNESDVEMDQVSISLHRKARVKRMIGIPRVLIVPLLRRLSISWSRAWSSAV